MNMDGLYVIRNHVEHFGKNDRKIEIPVNVVHIEHDAFKDNLKINKVTIHKNMRKMGASAFEGCSHLEKVKFLGESQLVVIPERCFMDCSSLKEFVVPSEVGVIKKYAFKGCTAIKHFVIPKGIVAVEAGAFDKWTEDQTIEMYSDFKFGCVCKATIINHAINKNNFIDEDVFETVDGKYMYAVLTKCGHVGRHRYMPITFPIIAESRKEAAAIAREIPRVKHDHKDAILEVTQISKRIFNGLQELNNEDPYLKFKSSYQQKDMKDLIDARAVNETENNRY